MKTNYMKMDRLIPWLGIALVAGGVAAAAAYLDLQRKIHSAEAFAVTLDHLYQDESLSLALKTLHDGDVVAAVQRLDLLLCDDILRLDSELVSADDRKAAYVKYAFVRMARSRPRNPDTTAGAAQELNADQIKAEKILKQACAGGPSAHEGATVAR
jgi:hypothetical protein